MTMKSLFQKHCTDERLLGHLDGELPFLNEYVVRKHLRLCWECRSRLSELEEQIKTVTKALEVQTFPASVQVYQARERFQTWSKQFENKLGPSSLLSLLYRSSWPFPRALTASVLLSLLAVGAWGYIQWVSLQPANVLTHAQKYERALYANPVSTHQSFQVEVIQDKPQEYRRASHLEVWAEPSSGRYAARWKDTGGLLQHAVWHPGGGRQYSYDSRLALAVVSESDSSSQRHSLADLSGSGLDLEQLETGFMKWLENRHWKPISFASDLSAFSSQGGVTLWAERIRSDQGQQAIRLSAQRRSSQLVVEIVMEVEEGTYRPQFQKISFETAERKVELRLFGGQVEVVKQEGLRPALFEPEVPVAPLQDRLELAKLDSPSTSSLLPTMPELAGVHGLQDNDPLVTEIEVLYALHRLKACLGEQIDVAWTKAGQIEVTGVVESSQRKAEILEGLKGMPRVTIRLQTIDEALRTSTRENQSIAQGSEPASTTAEHSVEVQSRRLPIQDQLEKYFLTRTTAEGAGRGSSLQEQERGGKEAARLQQKITELSNQAISLSQAAATEAWALRRLSERVSPARARFLQTSTRTLLERMIQDHMSGLQARVVQSRKLLEPVLTSMAGENSSSTEDNLNTPQTPDLNGTEWPAVSLYLLATCERMKRLMLGLFASVGLSGPASEGQTKESVRELMTTFNQLESGFQVMGKEVARELRN